MELRPLSHGLNLVLDPNTWLQFSLPKISDPVHHVDSSYFSTTGCDFLRVRLCARVALWHLQQRLGACCNTEYDGHGVSLPHLDFHS